jgi:hypothetical protein
MAAFTTTLAAIAIGTSIFSTIKSATQKVPKPPAIPPAPVAPTPAAPNISTSMSQLRGKSTAGGRSSTILTGASGVTTPATTQRSTLIGY